MDSMDLAKSHSAEQNVCCGRGRERQNPSLKGGGASQGSSCMGVAVQDKAPWCMHRVHTAVQAAVVDVPIGCMGQKIRGEGYE